MKCPVSVLKVSRSSFSYVEYNGATLFKESAMEDERVAAH
jgi:hypothetical protein